MLGTVQKHQTKWTVGNTLAGIAFVVSVLSTAFLFYGDYRDYQATTEQRIQSLERQTREQWTRISRNAEISDKVSRIDERTATIMRLLRDD